MASTYRERRIFMCIMEVRPGQRAATIAQALAHNASTTDRDLDMFRELLQARGDRETLDIVTRAQQNIHAGYADLLMVFGMECATHEHEGHEHEHGEHEHGNERSLVEVAHHDAGLARRFETR